MSLTLREKKLLNEAVTAETKRCLGVIKQIYYSNDIFEQVKDDLLEELFRAVSKEIIGNSPYLEFHPELKKKLKELG